MRGTYSRDVRAANLSERYDRTGGIAVLTDPRYPADGVINVTRFSGGNPSVQPEEADTFTAGIVVQPRFLPGFSASIDWYQIEINGAIGQLGAQAVVNRCEEGATELCALVTARSGHRTGWCWSATFSSTSTRTRSAASTSRPTTAARSTCSAARTESISARLFASWLDENSEALAGAATIDRAGQTGIQQSDGIAYSLPEWKATGNLTYQNGGFSAFLQGRYIGDGTLQNTLVEGVNIESNHVDSAFYADLALSYRWGTRRGRGARTLRPGHQPARRGSADHGLLQRLPRLFAAIQPVPVRRAGAPLHPGLQADEVSGGNEGNLSVDCAWSNSRNDSPNHGGGRARHGRARGSARPCRRARAAVHRASCSSWPTISAMPISPATAAAISRRRCSTGWRPRASDSPTLMPTARYARRAGSP
jgi:hypothetical protein